jgi:hypothetical protein
MSMPLKNETLSWVLEPGLGSDLELCMALKFGCGSSILRVRGTSRNHALHDISRRLSRSRRGIYNW